MRIIGIDPGIAIVGYSVLEVIGNKLNVLDYGCLYTSKELSISKRLLIIFEGLDRIIKLYKPNYMGVEELFYFKNKKTLMSVSQARGTILLAGEINSLELYSLTPLQVKEGVTGYGRADKKQVQLMVQRILGLEDIPKPDDAADALAVAIGVSNIIRNGGMGFQEKENIHRKGSREKIITKNKMTAKEYRELIKK